MPGAVDVLLAPELLEIGRMIEAGFPSPSRTTIVASTHRLYSIHEKMATGRGISDAGQLQAAARAFSRVLVAFDALAVGREHGTEVNAVLLGALAGCQALPIGAAAYRTAIERKAVQVAQNLKGFEVGFELGRRRTVADAPSPKPPQDLEAIIAQARARLVDYQDERYAARYLERLRPFLAGDVELATTVARHLAVWMTYEDAIRVADLKTRAGRFERIRHESAPPGAVVEVTDYLKPDLDELYGILPRRLVAPFARWAERRWPHGRPTLGQHVRTTTVLGFLRVWLLARCRRLRPNSYRAHLEHTRMERWLAAVTRAAAWDADLAHEIARAAQLVKGYGDVRRRMEALFDELVDTTLAVAALGAPGGDGFAPAAGFAARYRGLVLQGPEGEAEARRLAGALRAPLDAGDYDAARALLTTSVV